MAKKYKEATPPPPVRAPEFEINDSLTGVVNEPIRWIIEDLISEGEQMLVFGAPKVGKSQFVLQMAVAVAVGEGFHDWPASASGEGKKVLYVNLEIGERSFMRRIADHVIAEKRLGERPDPKNEIPEETLQKINEHIAGKLIFSSGIRTLGMSAELLKQFGSAGNKVGEIHPYVTFWHERLDEHKPDLIIYDTLSKMHSLDERENNAIQGVLTLIRTISTVQSEEDPNKRRELAHVIVHHSRKNSESSKGGGELSLDSIRGGSSIRAEADVIVGIFAGKNETIEVSKKMPREVVIEARNIEGAKATFQFDGVRFRLTTEEDVKLSEDARIRKIRDIFAKGAVRGISTGVLARKFGEDPNPNSTTYKASSRFLTKLVQEGKHLDVIGKSTHAHFDFQSAIFEGHPNASKFYWIPDGSDWLEIESIRNAIAATKSKNPETAL